MGRLDIRLLPRPLRLGLEETKTMERELVEWFKEWHRRRGQIGKSDHPSPPLWDPTGLAATYPQLPCSWLCLAQAQISSCEAFGSCGWRTRQQQGSAVRDRILQI